MGRDLEEELARLENALSTLFDEQRLREFVNSSRLSMEDSSLIDNLRIRFPEIGEAFSRLERKGRTWKSCPVCHRVASLRLVLGVGQMCWACYQVRQREENSRRRVQELSNGGKSEVEKMIRDIWG